MDGVINSEDKKDIRREQIIFLVTRYYEKLEFLHYESLDVLIEKSLNLFLDSDLTIDEINDKLSILDLKRIRAVCEDEIRNEKTGETWLDFYNSQIYDLRMKLKSLEAQL